MQPIPRRRSFGISPWTSRVRFGATTRSPSIGYDSQSGDVSQMVQTLTRSEARLRARPALVDGDFHNELNTIQDLYPYLARRWQEHIETHGLRGPQGAFYPRFMDHREDARPPSGRVSGSEVAHSARDYLDPYNVAFAVCIPLNPSSRQMNLELGAALAS